MILQAIGNLATLAWASSLAFEALKAAGSLIQKENIEERIERSTSGKIGKTLKYFSPSISSGVANAAAEAYNIKKRRQLEDIEDTEKAANTARAANLAPRASRAYYAYTRSKRPSKIVPDVRDISSSFSSGMENPDVQAIQRKAGVGLEQPIRRISNVTQKVTGKTPGELMSTAKDTAEKGIKNITNYTD